MALLASLSSYGTVKSVTPRFWTVVLETVLSNVQIIADMSEVIAVKIVDNPIVFRSHVSKAQREKVRETVKNAMQKKCQGSRCAGSEVSHKADLAKAAFGIDGSGIKVGVLSNGIAGASAGSSKPYGMRTDATHGPHKGEPAHNENDNSSDWVFSGKVFNQEGYCSPVPSCI